MRSKNVFLILVLLSIQIYSLKFDFTQFTEVKEMNNDPYANSLIQTINTELNAKGGKIESIQNLITDLYNKLLTDQVRANKEWYERERLLNSTIYDTKTLVLKLSEQITVSERKLAVTNQKIGRAQRNVKQYTQQYNQERTMVINLNIKRNEDKAAYKTNVYNSQNLLLALDQVMIALRKLKGSISGVNRPGHVAESNSEARDRNWKKQHGSALLQIFSEAEIDNFVQIATQADQDGLSKLLGLLLNLYSSAQKSLDDFERDEVQSKKSFNVIINNLTTDIQKLENLITRQKNNLTAYNSYRNSLVVELKEKKKLKAQNEEFLKQTVEQRRVELLRFEADMRSRNREKMVIRRIEKIVNEKLARMNAFVKSRVNQ
jgi:hypothetical protein